MNHACDRHLEKCFGMKENINKQTLDKFICKTREFVESSENIKNNYNSGFDSRPNMQLTLRLLSPK